MNFTNPNLTDFNNLDGEVQNLEVLNGLSNMNDNMIESYPNDFDNEESMSFFEGDDDFYNAKGSRKKRKNERARRRGLREKKQAQRQARRDKGAEARSQAKIGRTKAKLTQADTQKEIASKLGVETESDKALAQAMLKGAETTPEKKGMSTGAKIGIAVGVVAILGIIGFVVYKKMNSKK